MQRVLLIERHQMMRNAMRDLLAQNGREQVEEAADPIDGVHKIIANTPGIIILDTTWPEVNGLWLTRLLRELVPHGKIVLLLDDSRADYLEAARASGADACITKSMLANELMPILEAWKKTSGGRNV